MPDLETTTTMNLEHEITVNGVKYPKGIRVQVPKNQADDIARMDHDYTQYELGLIKKRTYEQQIRGPQ